MASGWNRTSTHWPVDVALRRTRDTDAAITTELAVDLLVPSLDGRFRPQEHDGRAFDSAPGLAPALAAEPIVIETHARLLDGALLEFAAPVPTVELALVIKALSYGSRLQHRDVEDIYRLLEIADSTPRHPHRLVDRPNRVNQPFSSRPAVGLDLRKGIRGEMHRALLVSLTRWGRASSG